MGSITRVNSHCQSGIGNSMSCVGNEGVCRSPYCSFMYKWENVSHLSRATTWAMLIAFTLVTQRHLPGRLARGSDFMSRLTASTKLMGCCLDACQSGTELKWQYLEHRVFLLCIKVLVNPQETKGFQKRANRPIFQYSPVMEGFVGGSLV